MTRPTPPFRSLLPALALGLGLALAGVAQVAQADEDDHRPRWGASGYDDDGYRNRDRHDDDDDDDDDHDHDHDRAHRALRAGHVLPLAEILSRLDGALGGRVIDMALEREDGRYLYEFKVVAPDGRLREAKVDAATGRLITMEDDD